jgi:hypothetical protein
VDNKVIKGRYSLVKLVIPFPAKHRDENANLSPISLRVINDSIVNTVIQVMMDQFGGDEDDLIIENGIKRIFSESGRVFRIGFCFPSMCSPMELESVINKLMFPILGMPFEIGPDSQAKDDPIQLNVHQLVSM